MATNGALGRKLRMGIVGGGQGSFIGRVHVTAAVLGHHVLDFWTNVCLCHSLIVERPREEGGGGGGDEAAFTAEEAAAAEGLSTRLSLLGAPEHMAALWRALLATPSPRSAATIISATQLAAAFCELLYGSGGNATGAAVEPHPRAAAVMYPLSTQRHHSSRGSE